MGAPTACKQLISGTFHSPNRGAFHLSLAVLFTIGRHRVFSLMPWSALIHTGFHVSGATQDSTRACRDFGYGAITLFRGSFQILLLSVQVPHRGPTTPQ